MTKFTVGLAITVAFCGAAHGSIVAEAEVGGIANNTVGTAQAISAASFTTPVPATVFNPPGWATATILGTGDSGSLDVDFYSFTTPGGGAMFDIDDTPFSFDTILSLFNSAGTLIAYDDDSSPTDAGTANSLDSFLGTITLSPGTYYLAVSQFSNFATQFTAGTQTSLTRPDGFFGGSAVTGALIGDSSFRFGSGPDGTAPYTLHVSLQNVSSGEVPEPLSLAVWSLLALTIGGVGWWKRPPLAT